MIDFTIPVNLILNVLGMTTKHMRTYINQYSSTIMDKDHIFHNRIWPHIK